MAFNLNNLKFNYHIKPTKRTIVKMATFQAELFLFMHQFLDT